MHPASATFLCRVQDERIYELGVADAKGGKAINLHVLELLHDKNWADSATITVPFNPDEGIGSSGSHHSITKSGTDADTVQSFEPTWSGPPVPYHHLLGHAAYAQVRLEVIGKAAHALQPKQGANAVEEKR